jgi:hypothetical protein
MRCASDHRQEGIGTRAGTSGESKEYSDANEEATESLEDGQASPGPFQNATVIRANTMKFLCNYFSKGQLTKMFFLFPDPHFKAANHRCMPFFYTLFVAFVAVGCVMRFETGAVTSACMMKSGARWAASGNQLSTTDALDWSAG